MISQIYKWLLCPLQPVLLFLQGQFDAKEFMVANVIISFGQGETAKGTGIEAGYPSLRPFKIRLKSRKSDQDRDINTVDNNIKFI